MSIKLAKYLYETYHWLFVGTIVINDSKDRNENSIPFRKLSVDSLKKVKRGWMRYSTRSMTGIHDGNFQWQGSTWKDKNK